MSSTVLYLIWLNLAALAAQRCKSEKLYFQHLKKCECKNFKEQNFFTKKFKKMFKNILFSNIFFFELSCLIFCLLLLLLVFFLCCCSLLCFFTHHCYSTINYIQIIQCWSHCFLSYSLIMQFWSHCFLSCDSIMQFWSCCFLSHDLIMQFLIILSLITQSDHAVSDHTISFIAVLITFWIHIMCISLSQKHQAIIQCHDQSYIHQNNRI